MNDLNNEATRDPTTPGPVYLDANAAAPPLPEVVEAMRQALLERWANPASPHGPGRRARALVEDARAAVGALVGAPADEVLLTSGATEAVRLAIDAAFQSSPSRAGDPPADRDPRAPTSQFVPSTPPLPHCLASPVEHPSVRDHLREREAAGALAVTWLPVDRAGLVDLAVVTAALAADPAPRLLCVQWASGETGAIQPVAALARAARRRGVPFLCDAAQAAGRVSIALPVDARPDYLALGARKLHGPGGIGALVVNALATCTPRIRRSGSEDAALAAGFAVAARLALEALSSEALATVSALRDRLELALVDLGAIVLGPVSSTSPLAERLPNTTCVRFPGVDGSLLVQELARRGVSCSSGSACSSHLHEPSPALLALGLDARDARGAIRFSLSRATTLAEIERATTALQALVPRLQRLGALEAAPR